MSKKHIVSLIIRTCKECNLGLFHIALQSIIENDYRPVEIIAVVQSKNDNFIATLQAIINNINCSGIQTKLVVNNTSADERARNLNLGIQVATGRYLGFLDDDDILYPHHLSSLVNYLSHSEKIAWAYTDSATAVCERRNTDQVVNVVSVESPQHKRNFFSIKKLCENGFIPIHSYLIDRNKVSEELLYFDESLKVLEDYAFMLKLAHSHLPEYIPVITCEYRFYTDASNSNFHVNQRLGKTYSGKMKMWREAYQKVEKQKKQLFPSYRTPILSFSTRSMIVAKFPILQRIKPYWKKVKKLISSKTVKGQP